jgi:GTPase SAR1 family protein
LKSFFGVRKEVNEIKIAVTQEEFLKKSWEVGKKQLHQRKIVPVIIWDFGGQDVFYSTHQTFLTYRAIYMLVLDGSRSLDESCSFEQYLPGKSGAKTQRGNSLFYTYGV